MRVLLSTGIGSRGDIQPMVALASRLRESGHEACLCAPPDFRDWIESLGFPVTPIGPPLRGLSAQPDRPVPQGHATGTAPERLMPMDDVTFAEQLSTITEAARGCDVLVATALQAAAPTVAELLGIRYVFAAFCPAFLPWAGHGPPPLSAARQEAPGEAAVNLELWNRHAARYNERLGPALNRHRSAAGLPPVGNVRAHIFTSRPWLAADPVLAPWPGPADDVFQTGAWILPDHRPLDPAVQGFLDGGEMPVYFGFGSMRVPPEMAEVITRAARQAGRRAIISAGSAQLTLTRPEPGCLLVGETNQQELFRHVAAVVHHGGAGTATAAVLAGSPQLIIPQAYDQHYWAHRIRQLGIGAGHIGAPTAATLAAALEHVLHPATAARSRALSATIDTHGTRTAATSLTTPVAILT